MRIAIPLRIVFEVSGSFVRSWIVSDNRLSIPFSLSKRYEGNSSNCSKYSSKTFLRIFAFRLVADAFNSSKLNLAGFGDFCMFSL